MNERRLIVAAAGWSGSTFGWGELAKNFKAKGFDFLQVRYPNKGMDSIEHSAAPLGRLLDVVRPEYDQCFFLGHSMGGIIGRYLIQRTAHSKHIDGYVSLASPHHGVIGSRLFSSFSESASQMDRARSS